MTASHINWLINLTATELSNNLTTVERSNAASPDDDDNISYLDLEPTISRPYYFDFIFYSITVPITFGLITIIGIFGNTLVIYVILSEKKMRTVTNLLLLNLAFADLSFVIICPPFTAYQMATSGWPFGDLACKLMHYLINVTAYVTVYTLVLISAIRFMTVVHSTETAGIRTKGRVVMTVVAIWFVMLSVNLPIVFSHGLAGGNNTVALCDNNGVAVGQAIFLTFFVFAYVLPLLAIAALSTSILRHIRKHQRPTVLVLQRRKSTSKKRQASRLIVLVVVLFALLWLPVHVHLLIYYFQEVQGVAFEVLGFVCSSLAYFNSCVNPIIYNFASKDFRNGFREIFSCGLTKKGKEELENRTRKIRGDNGSTAVRDTRMSVVVVGDGRSLFETSLRRVERQCQELPAINENDGDHLTLQSNSTGRTAVPSPDVSPMGIAQSVVTPSLLYESHMLTDV